MEVYVLLGAIIGGSLCAALAQKKNRNIGGWLIAGLCGGLIALAILAFLPTLGETASSAPKHWKDV